ncbi:MAG: hypothetical protein J0M18_10300 [Ignavibacteria bacterium]|nr:hypothetical protein [Ignavibacteria bacterium]
MPNTKKVTTKKTRLKKSSKKMSSARSKAQHEGAEKRKAELPAKRKRQYKHILESEKKEGRSTKSAERIAMVTVNKTRTKKGEAKSRSK